MNLSHTVLSQKITTAKGKCKEEGGEGYSVLTGNLSY